MTREQLQALIDRVIGKKGILRAPSYWMRKVLNNMTDYLEGYADSASQSVKVKVDTAMSDTSSNPVANKVVKNYVDDKIVDLSINASYSQLVNLKNYAQLVPGQTYRITDYETKTIAANTQSANNVFDVIVTAIDTETLSENAFACISERNESYFSSSNLSAWKLKYSLANDTSKFHWADESNGKGVIYYLEDEYGNIAHYDFKNIQFLKKIDYSGILADEGTEQYVYTFNAYRKNLSETAFDNSLNAECHDNYIGANSWGCVMGGEDYYTCFDNRIASECNNVFLFHNSVISCGIEVGANCNNLKIGGKNTKVGNECHDITSSGENVEFGNSCYNITNNSDNNAYASNCHDIVADQGGNTYGEGCYDITVNARDNVFGKGCNNIHGDGISQRNTFGDDSNDITFNGYYIQNCEFINSSRSITFNSNCEHCKFDNAYLLVVGREGDKVNATGWCLFKDCWDVKVSRIRDCSFNGNMYVDASACNNIRYVTFESGLDNIVIPEANGDSGSTSMELQYSVRYYTLSRTLAGTTESPRSINLERGRTTEAIVTMNSQGNVVVVSPDDLARIGDIDSILDSINGEEI